MTARMSRHVVLLTTICLLVIACEENPPGAGRVVQSSGKDATGLEAVPEAVLIAARNARPELELQAAEYEVRDGREYYDLAGEMPDGTELELDLTTVEGSWTVVEIQRDIDNDEVPAPVQEALSSVAPDWSPGRIIESEQASDLVIYEFFGPGGNDGEKKVEVKWEAGEAEVLRDEWSH